MRWPVVQLSILFAAIIAISPVTYARATVGPEPLSGPPPISLITDAFPLPVGSSSHDLDPTTAVSVTLTLTNPRSEELSNFLTMLEDPTSASYRHFLTYAEFVDRFAPPSSTVSLIETTLGNLGARDITAAPDRSSVSAVLSTASVEKLFGIHLEWYGSDGRIPLYTAVGTLSLPAALEGLVSGVAGLSDRATLQLLASFNLPRHPPEPASNGGSEFVHDNATGDWFVGSDYTQVYHATKLFPGAQSVSRATYPTSVAIATLLGSAFNQTTQANLPPWDPAVIDAYFNGTSGPGWPMPFLTGVPVTVNGITPPLPGSYGTQNDSTLFEYENSLDLEMAGSLAPGASLYNFYFAGSVLGGQATVGDAAEYLASDLATALAHNYSPAHLVAVSCSFGLPDLNDASWGAELLTAAATGVTILSASGDQGNSPDSVSGRSDGQWPDWPASAASNSSGSLSVGGVSLGLSGTPTSYWNGTALNLSYDSVAGTFSSVSAWYNTLGGQGAYAGTEGGISTVFPEPYWQIHSAAQAPVVNATVLERSISGGATALGRAGPDVAMPANRTVATVAANSTGTIFFDVLQGTSVAAPVLAGLLADVVAVENNGSGRPWTSLGFIDPEIYRIASYFASHSGAASDPFLDVTNGGNYVFSASAGWDPTTGWGGVDAPTFLAADRNASVANYNYSGPTPSLPPPSGTSNPNAVPWTIIYVIFGVGIAVAVLLVVLTARPSRPRPVPPVVPWGAHLGGPGSPLPPSPPGTFPGATFLCPYCGAVRPSEPVRCPQCGAL